jgi:hypothetical protein
MTTTATKAPPAYLSEARKRAGYANRDMVADAVPFSPESIGRHERGSVALAPEDALLYAEIYNAPEILPLYCANCPVGRKQGKSATQIPISQAVLQLHYWAAQIAVALQTMECIALDNVITPEERPLFDAALQQLPKQWAIMPTSR